MSVDKQLLNVELDRVIEKRRLDQALNAKEFAVLTGMSYSAARAWFRTPGFPVFRGVVFWQDFVEWRSARNGLKKSSEAVLNQNGGDKPKHVSRFANDLPPRALQILRQLN